MQLTDSSGAPKCPEVLSTLGKNLTKLQQPDVKDATNNDRDLTSAPPVTEAVQTSLAYAATNDHIDNNHQTIITEYVK